MSDNEVSSLSAASAVMHDDTKRANLSDIDIVAMMALYQCGEED